MRCYDVFSSRCFTVRHNTSKEDLSKSCSSYMDDRTKDYITGETFEQIQIYKMKARRLRSTSERFSKIESEFRRRNFHK